ncbi:hypothetical protein MMC28_004304 [Mycoblastus sanguinarius]|nr:hypothetical protein [Mycoblastus sanguinarius]
MTLTNSSTLEQRLTKALPEGCRFKTHHLSSPPTPCPAIYAAPPGEVQEETYCESHFLSVSIEHGVSHLQVFAIEVLIYTTKRLTTLFVSKADSTGYLYLLKLPQGTPSPFRIISTTFLQYLIERRRRPRRRLVLSLFARAQNQYLFPGSVENSHKHVLDDRGLIKWWCQVVNPILGEYENDSKVLADKCHGTVRNEPGIKSHGFLRVPGCDTYGTQSFLPKGECDKKRGDEEHRWSTTDPLCELGKPASLPERCLIPRFPDDPKARFVETLDDEIPIEDSQASRSQSEESPSKKQDIGRWRSVRSLEQFWEMMSFRQECSSGRLVGFLWAVFRPAKLLGENEAIIPAEFSYESPGSPSPTPLDSQSLEMDVDEAVKPAEFSYESPSSALPTPLDSQHQESDCLPPASPLRSSPVPEIPLTPRRLSQAANLANTPTPMTTPRKVKVPRILKPQPAESKYYYWPASSRGEIILHQTDYNRVGKLLLRLDYADETIAADSTIKWINAVAEKAVACSWGRIVVGESKAILKSQLGNAGNHKCPAVLGTGLIRKNKRSFEEVEGLTEPANTESGVNVLSSGLVRKRTKLASPVEPETSEKSRKIFKAEPAAPVASEESQSHGKTEPG